MSLGFLARMLTEFFPTGTLKELTANFRATVPHNTALTCSGVVTEKQTRNGEHILFCDVVLSNDEGERYVQGTAQVALPLRGASLLVRFWSRIGPSYASRNRS
jgi:hypothetical protein